MSTSTFRGNDTIGEGSSQALTGCSGVHAQIQSQYVNHPQGVRKSGNVTGTYSPTHARGAPAAVATMLTDTLFVKAQFNGNSTNYSANDLAMACPAQYREHDCRGLFMVVRVEPIAVVAPLTAPVPNPGVGQGNLIPKDGWGFYYLMSQQLGGCMINEMQSEELPGGAIMFQALMRALRNDNSEADKWLELAGSYEPEDIRRLQDAWKQHEYVVPLGGAVLGRMSMPIENLHKSYELTVRGTGSVEAMWIPQGTYVGAPYAVGLTAPVIQTPEFYFIVSQHPASQRIVQNQISDWTGARVDTKPQRVSVTGVTTDYTIKPPASSAIVDSISFLFTTTALNGVRGNPGWNPFVRGQHRVAALDMPVRPFVVDLQIENKIGTTTGYLNTELRYLHAGQVQHDNAQQMNGLQHLAIHSGSDCEYGSSTDGVRVPSVPLGKLDSNNTNLILHPAHQPARVVGDLLAWAPFTGDVWITTYNAMQFVKTSMGIEESNLSIG